MQVIQKSSSGTQSFPLDAMLLAQRTVFLTGEINTSTVNAIIQQLLFLESADATAPIKLIITSPGGTVQAGLALYDQLKGMTVRGHRFILRHSMVMIHEPQIASASGGVCGSASSIQKTAESILTTKRELTGLLARDTGHRVEEIEAAIGYDNFMKADEAVAFGICDRVVDRV